MYGADHLSLEQQFNLRSFETQVGKLNLQEAQEFLVKLYQHMLVREVLWKNFVGQSWGITPPSLENKDCVHEPKPPEALKNPLDQREDLA